MNILLSGILFSLFTSPITKIQTAPDVEIKLAAEYLEHQIIRGNLEAEGTSVKTKRKGNKSKKGMANSKTKPPQKTRAQ